MVIANILAGYRVSIHSLLSPEEYPLSDDDSGGLCRWIQMEPRVNLLFPKLALAKVLESSVGLDLNWVILHKLF